MFDSGDIPQNATFTYIVTKETEVTDKYDLYDDNDTNIKATLWVRDNNVYVDMISTTGGGVRGLATVDVAGTVINIAVDRPGQGYVSGDSVRIVDVSGPGEGAYAYPVLNRSIAVVDVLTAGTGYSSTTQIIAIDPTGTPVYDIDGVTEIDRIFGSGAILRPVMTTAAVAEYCSDTQYTDQGACEGASETWTPAITLGEILSVTVVTGGSNYHDIDFVINDPNSTGGGATLKVDLNNVITDIVLTSRGQSYDEPLNQLVVALQEV